MLTAFVLSKTKVTVPKALQALMSAEVSKDIVEVSDKKTNKFEQKVPIPAYLIAIAVGHIKSKKIGPRTTVWSEPEFVDASAYEFAETEEMLNAAEQLMGKLVQKIVTYDKMYNYTKSILISAKLN